MVLGYHSHTIDYYQKMYALNQYLAHQGYIVLSVNYRGGTGYGKEFREAEKTGGRGASEVRDVIGAGLYLRGRSDVDSAVLLIHGDDDRNLLFPQSVMLYAELRRHGIDVEHLVFPDDEHPFLLHSNWLRAWEAAADFFDRKLKKRATATQTSSN